MVRSAEKKAGEDPVLCAGGLGGGRDTHGVASVRECGYANPSVGVAESLGLFQNLVGLGEVGHSLKSGMVRDLIRGVGCPGWPSSDVVVDVPAGRLRGGSELGPGRLVGRRAA